MKFDARKAKEECFKLKEGHTDQGSNIFNHKHLADFAEYALEAIPVAINEVESLQTENEVLQKRWDALRSLAEIAKRFVKPEDWQGKKFTDAWLDMMNTAERLHKSKADANCKVENGD